MKIDDPRVQAMADAAQSFCQGWLRNAADAPRLLVLSGDPGTGKTLTLRRIASYGRSCAAQAWDLGGHGAKQIPSVVKLDWSDLCDREARELFDDAQNASMLCLDDIGTEADKFRSGEGTERLRSLLGRRENKWTVVTTNISPSKWGQVWDQRVADRLMRGSHIVLLEGVKSFAVRY